MIARYSSIRLGYKMMTNSSKLALSAKLISTENFICLHKIPSQRRTVLMNRSWSSISPDQYITDQRNSTSKISPKFQRPVVICGPSGTGKSTIINKLMTDFPDTFGFSVSHTTRKPRAGEIDGVNYHFITKEEFLSGAERGDFIELAEFSGNMYATSKLSIKDIQDEGKICILDLEMKGVKQIKESREINPLYVFIQPPNISDLENRLRGRKSETEDSLNKRLAAAKSDLDYVSSSNIFDTVIINDEVDKATHQLANFIFRDSEN